MTRDEALAICFANLKGPRDKDLLQTARALQHLKRLPEYGSNAKVGEAVGVSGEMVREFLVLLSLPKEAQLLLDQRRLSLDQGRRLWQLARKRPELVREAAEEMTTLNVLDSRHLVDYILRHPNVPVAEARARVLGEKTVTSREYHVIVILPEEDYKALQRRSRRRKVAPDALASEVIRGWLHSASEDADE